MASDVSMQQDSAPNTEKDSEWILIVPGTAVEAAARRREDRRWYLVRPGFGQHGVGSPMRRTG